MNRLYDKKYLEIAQDSLGEAVDYAVNAIGMEGDFFLKQMIRSGYAELFEQGDPRVLFGMSGSELVDHILMECGLDLPSQSPLDSESYSSWYWAGWILAYYQWESGLPFSRIREFLPLEDIVMMYHPLHEAPENKFVETAENLRRTTFRRGVRLKRLREDSGFSQRQLSERSGVGLRAIQQYEQGAKRIEQASAGTLYALSRTLHCHMEDLLDLPVQSSDL